MKNTFVFRVFKFQYFFQIKSLPRNLGLGKQKIFAICNLIFNLNILIIELYFYM